MSREIRMVPAHWQHPKNDSGHYKPLFEGFNKSLATWLEEKAQWEKGFRRDYANDGFKPRATDETGTYEEWAGEKPDACDYMPEWPAEQRTHLQMYETCSEGTPISPPCTTPEECARWLADHKASAFGSSTATYEQWLATCKSGWAPSAIIANGRFMSGVEAGAP